MNEYKRGWPRSRRPARGKTSPARAAVARTLREWRGVAAPEAEAGPGASPLVASVRKVMRSLGLESRMRETALLARWAELVGAEVAAHARPFQYRHGTLIVLVDHPTWMWELQSVKPLMVRRINAELGRGFVRDIVFRADG